MIVDIEKIIIKDRIRKDFGDIQELADDIKQNGLINPPVVNKDYELLAGERRLRACESLGWKQIEIRMMDTRDAEHELNVEISENENRKEFSKAERVDYMKRLMRIEQAKAEERMKNPMKNSSEGTTRQIVSDQFGISFDTMRREMQIVDNKDLLSPEDFAEWDEGKLSTNKAFLKIKARQKELETENEMLRNQISENEVKNVIERKRLEHEIEKAKEEHTVIEVKEVVKEVAPADYADLQSRVKYADDCQSDYKRMKSEYDRMKGELKKAETENRSLKDQIGKPETEMAENLKRSALMFCAGVKNFIEEYGGYVWLTGEINNLAESEREGYIRAVQAIKAWVIQLEVNLDVKE